MSSLRDDELERILHPVRDENYMEEYAKAQVDLVHGALNLVEEGMPVDTVEREFWNHMDTWNQWLVDQRGSVEWWTLTEGDTIRMCTDDDPLPFFTSPENDEYLCRRYSVTRGLESFSGMMRAALSSERGITYDASIHNHTTVSQITREEHSRVIDKDRRTGLIQNISDMTGWNYDLAQEVFDSRRLLGYLSVDDHDIAPKVVLFAYDEDWDLMYANPVFDGYIGQNLLVPFTSNHEAYDHVIEDLKEDMATRHRLTLREGWPRP